MLERLPRDLARQVIGTLRDLEENPRPQGAKRLVGHDLWRIRVRDWRIIYQIRDLQLLVLVVKIASRGNAYTDL